jgi:hypothetical protein
MRRNSDGAASVSKSPPNSHKHGYKDAEHTESRSDFQTERLIPKFD